MSIATRRHDARLGEYYGGSTPCEPSAYLQRKRLVVRCAGLVIGLLLTPVILVLGFIVQITSRGPALYRQRRVGLYGREFTMFKLRSMCRDAEKDCGPVWAQKKDARITSFGRFLRYTHLDELPQIYNVIRGEMDFIGPRPERPELIISFLKTVPNYDDRMSALPGITGLAQVNLPPDETLACVCNKVAADRYYIKRASLWLDARLIAATVLRICGLRYYQGARLLGVTLQKSVRDEGALALQMAEEAEACFREAIENDGAELCDTDVEMESGQDTVLEREDRAAPPDSSRRLPK